ncbi:hypothetical protein OBBRIDRAFT_499489 [Obba rivulosa]|uniref:Copper transport protein n=1 Tax=Obba rivulosa TaxID=1052685 RepID=A0A8E2DTX2_9APHY|nr:hypothetical protein OBBRIDRAFT_499489 [Obba rivulosa]
MKMDGWQDYLHFSFLGEHILFPSLRLDSSWNFIVASVITIVICSIERLLTYGISVHWDPLRLRNSRLRNAAWRTCLYWLVTFVRLLYMLIAMTFNAWLLVITVTALSAGQFTIELLETPKLQPAEERLLSSHHEYDRSSQEYSSPIGIETYPPPMSSRPRSRTKPESIFIHPAESNLARADAAAVNLGLSGDTELVKANEYPADEDSWELGKGKDVARALLGRS